MVRCYVVIVEDLNLEHTVVRTRAQVCYSDDTCTLKIQQTHVHVQGFYIVFKV